MTKETLVVVSKVKAYIKAKGGHTSADSIEALSGRVQHILDCAVNRAKANRRTTVKSQDI